MMNNWRLGVQLEQYHQRCLYEFNIVGIPSRDRYNERSRNLIVVSQAMREV